ncbi:MAG TPA: undecaprenyl diphosphate synthase family protein [Thermoanaerobaculia bacterium]|nr:undecaprenyl diphosphate synthase family protein [Thermoanaerobaculia bacterium]
MTDSAPRHVGLIPDGARRWSRQNNTDLLNAYNVTMEGLVKFVDQAFLFGVEALSIFLLSMDNLDRHQDEIDPVTVTEERLLKERLVPIIKSHKARVVHAGRKNALPPGYASAMSSLCSASESHSNKRLYLLAAYDPVDELRDIIFSPPSGSGILEKLWVPEQVDLVIRTGGESRLSGFLPIQSIYAELVFLPELFNDITPDRLIDPIRSFDFKRRRFGR